MLAVGLAKPAALFTCVIALVGCRPSATTPAETPATAPSQSQPSRDVDPSDELEQVNADVQGRIARGDGDGALSIAQRFHTSMVKRLGPDDPITAAALLLVAHAQAARGAHAEAFEAFRQAMPRLEPALRKGKPQVGQVLGLMAVFAWRAGRADEAATAAERAIPLLEHELGANHAEVAQALWTLGNARLALNDAPAAAAAFRRSLEIRERAFGASHPVVGASAAALATAEYARGEDATAAHFFERARAVFEKNLDTELDAFAEVAENLAMARGSSDPAGSEVELRRALTVVEQRRGRRDQAYLQVASSLASVLASRRTKSQTSVELAKLGVESRCTPEQVCVAAAAGTPKANRPRPGQSLAAMSDGAQAIERLRPAFGVCVEAARSRNRNTNGIVRVALDVGSAGTASSARGTATGLDDLLISCLLEVALGAKFQPPAGGHLVVVIPLSVEPKP